MRWAVEQGLSVFMVSWKSADASLAGITLDDYVAAQIEAIDVIRDLLGVEGVHAIGYCVAGTTFAATLALLAARGEADKVKSATFFTAQVDFSSAGDLSLFVDDKQLELIADLAGGKGYIDGRYLAASFNLLRGRDLIWNTVVQNYLLGEEHPAFDLLHWNGDTTNLPALWHLSYLRDLYRDNLLVRAGRDRRRGYADRPLDGGDAELHPGRPRGSYRARRKRLEDHRAFHRAAALRARRIGAYRRRGQPSRGDEISILDQRRTRRVARRLRRPGARNPRAAGGRTGAPWLAARDDRMVPAKGARGSRKRQAQGDRKRPGTLRFTALIAFRRAIFSARHDFMLHCTIILADGLPTLLLCAAA